MFRLIVVLERTLRKVKLLKMLQTEPKAKELDTEYEYVQHKVLLWHQQYENFVWNWDLCPFYDLQFMVSHQNTAVVAIGK